MHADQEFLLKYIPVGMIILAALGLGVGQMIIGTILGPKAPTKVKLDPYECGIEAVGPAQVRMSVKFSLVALLFLLFDIEVIYIWLWAIGFNSGLEFSGPGLSFQLFVFFEMMIFLTVIVVGFLYEWRKGALDWT